jgi:adenine-specific DNA methylase
VARYPADSVLVDLFGGSGLLSHIARRVRPEASVIYNDFDGFAERLQAIPQTNELLERIWEIALI